MEEKRLLEQLHTLNESEEFYRRYRQAEATPGGLQAFLEQLDADYVRKNALLIPEWPETISPEYLEESFFSPDRRVGIHVSKHNCFTPPVPHHHDFFEMFYVLDGQCVHRVGGQRSVLGAGDLCLIQPHVTHSLDVSDESIVIDVLMRRSTFRNYFYSILQGDNVLSNFFLSTLYSRQGISYLIFHTGGDDPLYRAFTELCGEFFEKKDYYSTLVNALLTKVFVHLLRSHLGSSEMPEDEARDTQTAVRIARYLQLNAANADLNAMAAELHYSPEYTSRQIRRITGRTFIQLLTTVRLENAEHLLRDTALPVADIAATVGYESTEHFIRTFRRHKGMTPTDYRHLRRA